MSLPIPFVGSGEAYDMPINPATALATFMNVVGIVAIPGLGAVLGILFSQLFTKDYKKEIGIFQNVTKPMSDALARKDFVSAVAGIRSEYYRQEPQHTHIVYAIQGWGPDQISRLQPQVQNAMFTAMLGYGMQTKDWNALKVFGQELQGIDDYHAPKPENLFPVEGYADPVAINLQSDNEGGESRPDWIFLNGQTYRWDDGEYSGVAQFVRDNYNEDGGD